MSIERVMSIRPLSLWRLAVGYFPSPHSGLTLTLDFNGE